MAHRSVGTEVLPLRRKPVLSKPLANRNHDAGGCHPPYCFSIRVMTESIPSE